MKTATAHGWDAPETMGAELLSKDQKNQPARLWKLDKLCRLRRRKRRAAAVVEFAIVAPLFFFFVLGLVEYGRMVMVQQILVNASREGARRAVLDGATASEVDSSVQSFLASSSIHDADVTITPPDPSTTPFGQPVTVSVSVSFSDVSWLPSPMFLGGQTLRASTVMRRESVQ